MYSFGAICASLQFIPQIVTTFLLKRVGALSIPTMLIQTPGSFLFVYSIAIQQGTNWTSYINYVASGTLQGLLLTMCLVWVWQERVGRTGYQPIGDDADEGNEGDDVL